MPIVAPQPNPQQPVQVNGRSGAKRLLVVDDHPAVRAGLRQLLEHQADFEVVAAVASAEEALSVAEEEPIDVAVVDYQLDGRNGLWVSRKLKRLPRPPAVLIYSAYTDGVVSSAAVIAEADGIVSKGGLGSDLCAAIRRVARGHHLLAPVPPWLGEVLRQRLDHEEQAIFGLLLAGIGPAEIADTLGLSEAGLESRLWAMLRKVEASDRARHGERAAGAAEPRGSSERSSPYLVHWARPSRVRGEATRRREPLGLLARSPTPGRFPRAGRASADPLSPPDGTRPVRAPRRGSIRRPGRADQP